MTWSLFWLCVSVWLGTGFITVLAIGWHEWYQGVDLELEELLPIMFMILLGGITLCLVLYEIIVKIWLTHVIGKVKNWLKNRTINGKTVILPGSKSAKAYKALTSDKWPNN